VPPATSPTRWAKPVTLPPPRNGGNGCPCGRLRPRVETSRRFPRLTAKISSQSHAIFYFVAGLLQRTPPIDKDRPVGRSTSQLKARRVRPHTYELRPLLTETERNRYHAIRQTCLFDVYHPWIPYDRFHPDEHAPGNHPLGFFADGALVGTIRIDLKPDGRAVFRMVAIAAERRGHHLGSRLLSMAEDYARTMGASSICLNSVQPALPFYTHRGYAPVRWEGCTTCPTSTPVMKPIGRGSALLPPAGMIAAAGAEAARAVAMA
jgi:GNAT superfamily N-acetyltransferase